MHTTAETRWNQRRFVAVAAALSGLALPATGLADHLSGQAGAPASWSVVHTSLGTLFAGLVIWHCVLNRRALAHHLRDTRRAVAGREALAAAVLVGVVLAATVLHALVGP